MAVGDVTRQTEQVMANLATALEAAGAGLTDVVKRPYTSPATSARISSPPVASSAPVLATTTSPARC